MATSTQRVSPAPTKRAVRFEFQAPPTAQRVALVGDFNYWNLWSQTMRKQPSGLWEITVDLVPGRHQYKFLVDGNQWLTDPKAKEQASNQYGTNNSVIEVR